MKLSVRHLKWRHGRPRWEPSPKLRGAWKGRDLKDEAGRWLDMQSAIAAAETINAEVDTWRERGMPRRRPAPPAPHAHSLRRLWSDYTQSRHFKTRADSTREGYTKHARVILDESPFADEPVRAITRPLLITWYELLIETRGLAMANGILAVMSVLMSHAERRGWRDEETNPAFHMGRETPAPRVVIWTPAECVRMVAVADRSGHIAIGDAFVLALHTAQRLGDVLMTGEPEEIGGKARFTLAQRKTAARVSVPLTSVLASRLADIRRRRRAGKIVAIGHNGGPLVERADGRPYITADTPDTSQFNKDFREVRRLASIGDAARSELAMPAIEDKRFQDLRDTAITRLALAECTLAEIRAISGHSLETVTSVLKHYLVMDEAMADGAVAKLQAWMQREGVKV